METILTSPPTATSPTEPPGDEDELEGADCDALDVGADDVGEGRNQRDFSGSRARKSRSTLS